jgi:nitrogen fixation NifU-like protein
MMSAAVKGRTLAQARATIRAFRSMMSLHEQHLDVPEGASPGSLPLTGEDPAEGTGTGRAGQDQGADGSAVEEVVPLGDLEALQGVVKFPVRIKCATLSWHTLSQALDEADAAQDN